jgi:hypothetical protein
MRAAALALGVSMVVACPLLAGCATTSYSRTRVEALPSGLKGKAGDSTTVEIEGLKLRIEALDRTRKEQAIPPLALHIVFDPRVVGYSFDPSQVVTVDLGGLTVGPRRIESIALRLARRAGTSIDRVYWLEGLGYLLAPLGGG